MDLHGPTLALKCNCLLPEVMKDSEVSMVSAYSWTLSVLFDRVYFSVSGVLTTPYAGIVAVA